MAEKEKGWWGGGTHSQKTYKASLLATITGSWYKICEMKKKNKKA